MSTGSAPGSEVPAAAVAPAAWRVACAVGCWAADGGALGFSGAAGASSAASGVEGSGAAGVVGSGEADADGSWGAVGAPSVRVSPEAAASG